VLVAVLAALLASSVGPGHAGTTTAQAAISTYDAPTFTRVHTHVIDTVGVASLQPTGSRQGSASPLSSARGTSTTLSATFIATEAEIRASSAANGARLNEQLRLTEKYGAGGVMELPDGRMRFYGEATAAKTPGEMAGARLVHEWDPATGAEVLDPSPVGKSGVAQAGGEAAVAIGGGLFGDEAGEELDMRPAVGACLFGEQFERPGRGVEVEVAEVGFDLLVEAAAHRSRPGP
jgi:hypothetical protein